MSTSLKLNTLTSYPKKWIKDNFKTAKFELESIDNITIPTKEFNKFVNNEIQELETKVALMLSDIKNVKDIRKATSLKLWHLKQILDTVDNYLENTDCETKLKNYINITKKI
jgi:hypothetical protein